MTLTAIDSEHKLFSPWAMLSQGLDDLAVRLEMMEVQREGGFFCPHCFQVHGEMVPVRYRSGSESRKPHFFHKSEGESDRPCPSQTGETERHFNAKIWIAEELKRKSQGAILKKNLVIEVDRIYVNSSDGKKRRPDILAVYGNGSKIAHEVQVSYIPLLDEPEKSISFDSRTKDLLNECDIVVWWLFDSTNAYKRDDVRKYLSTCPGVQFKRFWFSSDGELVYADGAAPDPNKKKSVSAKKQDTCSYSVAKQEREKLLRTERRQREESFAENQLGEIEDEEDQGEEDSLMTSEEFIHFYYLACLVGHSRKPGWVGKIFDSNPWNIPGGLAIDVMWVFRSDGKDLPMFPQRYSSKDILFSPRDEDLKALKKEFGNERLYREALQSSTSFGSSA